MMNLRKIVGIIAVIAILGFVFLSCEEESAGTTSYGETLKLSGQVFKAAESNLSWTDIAAINTAKDFEKAINEYYNADPVKFTGTVKVSYGEKEGTITNGTLSFEMGAPNADDLYAINSYIESLTEDGYKEAKVDKTDAKIYVLYGLQVKDSDDYNYVGRGKSSGKYSIKNDGSFTGKFNSDSIVYIYVTDAVKVTAKGYPDVDGLETTTYKDINLSLKKGWNVVKSSYSGDEKGTSFTSLLGVGTGVTSTGTVTITTGDSGTQWMIH